MSPSASSASREAVIDVDKVVMQSMIELDEPLAADFNFDTVIHVDCKAGYGSAILTLQLEAEATPPPPKVGMSPGGSSSAAGSQSQPQ